MGKSIAFIFAMSAMPYILLFSTILLSAILFSGCTSTTDSTDTTDSTGSVTNDQKSLCISLCEKYLANGTNLSNGPCLSNQIADDWVCDVAHSPREQVDNNPDNQCPAFRQGQAHHFIEVDPSCVFIQEQ